MRKMMIAFILAMTLYLLFILEQYLPFPSILIAFFVGRIWWDVADYDKDFEIEVAVNKIVAMVEGKLIGNSVVSDSVGQRGGIASISNINGKQE